MGDIVEITLCPGFVYGDISPRDSCDISPFFDFIVDHNFMRHFNMHGWCFCRWRFSFFCVLLQTTAVAFTFPLWLQMHRLLSFFPSLSHFRRYGIFPHASVRWCCFYSLTGEILLIFRWVLFRIYQAETTLLCSCSLEISFVFQIISLL